MHTSKSTNAICCTKENARTNGLENFWSLLKRTIHASYVGVEPSHLFRYLDEQAFRINERKNTDASRFLIGILGVIGKRLKYLNRISGAGSHELPTTGSGETEKEGRRRMKWKPFGGHRWDPLQHEQGGNRWSANY